MMKHRAAIFAVFTVLIMLTSAFGAISISNSCAESTSIIGTDTLRLSDETGTLVDNFEACGIPEQMLSYTEDEDCISIVLNGLNYETSAKLGMDINITVIDKKVEIILKGNNTMKSSGSGSNFMCGIRIANSSQNSAVLIHGGEQDESVPSLTASTTGHKDAAPWSGGIVILADTVEIDDCSLTGNAGDNEVSFDSGNMNLVNCGIYCKSDNVKISNSVVTGNAGKSILHCDGETAAGYMNSISVGIYFKTDGSGVIAVNDTTMNATSAGSSLSERYDSTYDRLCQSSGLAFDGNVNITKCNVTAKGGPVVENSASAISYGSLKMISDGIKGHFIMDATTCNAESGTSQSVSTSGVSKSTHGIDCSDGETKILNGSTVTAKSGNSDTNATNYGIVGRTTVQGQCLTIDKSDVTAIGDEGSIVCLVSAEMYSFTNVGYHIRIIDENGTEIQPEDISDNSWVHIVNNYTVTYKPGVHTTGTEYTETAAYMVEYTVSMNTFAVDSFWGFNHWEDENGKTYKAGEKMLNESKTESLTLTAVCVQGYFLVTYVTGIPDMIVPSIVVPYGQTAYMPKIKWEGHTLIGWYDGDTKWDFTKPVTRDVTLKARWNVTVTFDDGGAGVTIDPQTVEMGSRIESPTISWTGYTFLGWYHGDTKWDFFKGVDHDMTLTAKWLKNVDTVTVTFNPNGGTGVASQTMLKGETATEPKCERSGHVFLGWYANDQLWNFNTPVNNDITLAAKWVEIREDLRIGTDDKGNIEIVVPQGAKVNSITIENAVMNIIISGETMKDVIGNNLKVSIQVSNEESAYVLGMKLNYHAFKGDVTIEIPLKDKNVTNPKVYLKQESGEVEKKSSFDSKNNIISFETDCGGTYVVKYTVTPEPVPTSSDTPYWVAVVGILLILLLVIGGLWIDHRHRTVSTTDGDGTIETKNDVGDVEQPVEKEEDKDETEKKDDNVLFELRINN